MKTIDVASLKACKGLYSVGDTARHFGVSKGTVWNVWHGRTHTDVRPVEEAPRLTTTRVKPEIIKEDYPILKNRGLTPDEIASYFGIAKTTLWRYTGGEAA